MGVLAAVSTALPLLAFLARFGVAAPLSLFQSDAFYYLDITRNSAGRSGYTFDGQHLTNGFHPLWQYLLSFCQWLRLFQLTSPVSALQRIFFIDVSLLALGAGCFTVFIARQLRIPSLALLATAPGLLWFLVSPITAGYLSTWSYANGLESAVSFAAMAAALCVWQEGRASMKRDAAFSIFFGLALLARLDDAFFLVALVIVGRFRMRAPIVRLLLWTFPAACMLAIYLLYNRGTVGVFLPLSGVAKAGYGFKVNTAWSAKLLIPMLTKRLPRILTPDGAGDGFGEEAFRAFQMVVPAAICAVHLLYRPLRSSSSWIVQTLCLGVILKSLYNFVFVPGGYQGPWYYTVSVSVANMVLVLWLSRLLNQIQPTPRFRGAFFLGYGLLVLYSASAYYGIISQAWGPLRLRALQDGPEIAAKLEQQGHRCFLEFDDGYVGFALRMPSESGFGLALDLPATEALRQGTFLPLMQQRGCLFGATFSYAAANAAYINGEEWKTGKPLWGIQAREFERYRLVPDNDLSADGITFYTFQPAELSANKPVRSDVIPAAPRRVPRTL